MYLSCKWSADIVALLSDIIRVPGSFYVVALPAFPDLHHPRYLAAMFFSAAGWGKKEEERESPFPL